MTVEAFAIAGASLATIVIAKIKFYVKKNGVWTCSTFWVVLWGGSSEAPPPAPKTTKM